jgi:DNA-binding beta-propeller fold protein YncE
MKSPLLATFFALAATAGAAAADETPPSFRSTAHFALGGGADCAGLGLDASARRVYVGHGDAIDVLDADSGAKTGSVAVPGASAIEIAPEAGRGFAATSSNSVAIFDLKTGAVLKTVPLPGRSPSALAYDGDEKRLFVAQADSGDLAVVDPEAGSVVTDVALGGRLRAVVSDGYRRLFVSAEDANVLHVVSTESLQPLGDDPVAPGVGPTGLAIDPGGRRVFAACANGNMVVVDGDAGCVFSVLAMGQGGGPAVFDRSKQPGPGIEPPWKARILAAAHDGTLSSMKMNAFISYSFHDNVTIPAGALALAFDPKGGRALVLYPHELLVLSR